MTRKPNKKRRQQRQRSAGQNQRPDQTSGAPPPSVPIVPEVAPGDSGEPRQDRSNNQDDWKDSRAMTRYARWQAFCAVGILLFTLGQVVVGYWQWDATDKQWQSMERQLDLMELEQRPVLTISVPTIVPMVLGDDLKLQFKVENVGNTPAHVSEVTIAGLILPTAAGIANIEKAVLNDMDNHREVVAFAIAPHSTHSTGTRDGYAVAQRTEEAFFAGEITMLVAIRYVYFDASGREHVTERWFITDPDADAFVGFGNHDQMK